MRKAMAFAMVMAMTAGMAAADGAMTTAAAAKPAKKESAKKPHAMKLAGLVTAVDAASGKLSVKSKKGEMKDFTVAADAKVMKGSAKATLADVAVNDEVTVTYEMNGDAMVVKSVRISVAKKKAEKK